MDAGERDHSIDAIRGFLIFAILFDNVALLSLSKSQFATMSGMDAGLWVILNAVFSGRFISYLLFGLCLGIAYAGVRELVVRQYMLRAVVLMLFGLFNYFVLQWDFDILMPLGMCSLMIYPLLKSSGKKVLSLSVVVGVVFYGIAYIGVISPLEGSRDATSVEAVEKWSDLMQRVSDKSLSDSEAMSSGYWNSMQSKVRGISDRALSLFTSELWESLTVMLFGLALYKMNIIGMERKIFGWVGVISGVLGLFWCATLFYQYWSSGFEFVLYEFKYISWQYFVGRLLLAVGYGCGIVYICRSGKLRRITKAMSVSGRYALSNYLLQTMLFMIVFIGFRQHGLYSVSEIYLWLCFVGGVMVVTNVYLHRRGMMGPAEYIARALYKA